MTYIFLTHFIHYIFIIFIASCFPYFNLSMMQKIIFYTHYVNNLSVQYQYDIHSSCFEYFFKTNSTFSIFLSFFPFHQKIFPFLSPFLYNYSKKTWNILYVRPDWDSYTKLVSKKWFEMKISFSCEMA